MNELSGEISRIIIDLDELWNCVQDSELPEETRVEISREIEEACGALDRAMHYFPPL